MAAENKKWVSVKIDQDLHNEITDYLQKQGMTMVEFVNSALENELHPKNQEKEGNNMANTRTIALQVPEELFQRIKDYLQRNSMTQRQFLIGLIETELNREQTEREAVCEAQNGERKQDEEIPIADKESDIDGFADECDDPAEEDDEYEDEDEAQSPVLGM